jgi:cold shock CspA family protein
MVYAFWLRCRQSIGDISVIGSLTMRKYLARVGWPNIKDDCMIGVVTWFNVAKGYGEIYAEAGEVFFFTYLDLPKVQKFRSIERGKLVEFDASSEVHFTQRVAKKIRHLKSISKKHESVVEQLRSVVS